MNKTIFKTNIGEYKLEHKTFPGLIKELLFFNSRVSPGTMFVIQLPLPWRKKK